MVGGPARWALSSWTKPTATDEICPEETEEVIAALNRIRPNNAVYVYLL
jgi:hypothetical protein